MRAINHALTGALIGLVITEPMIAVPLAVASHFACDAIPHFGVQGSKDIRARWFTPLLIVDALLCFVVVAILALRRPEHWLLAEICAFLAASPDLFSAPRLKRLFRGGNPDVNLKNPFLRFHSKIQWFERPPGLIVEIAWLGGLLCLLAPFFR